MKIRKFLVLVLVGVFMLNFATGCKSTRQTIIYESGAELLVVYADDETSDLVNSFVNKLNMVRGQFAKVGKDSTPKAVFEIVIGETNRDISKKAYNKLKEVKKKNNEYVGYLFFCEKNSLAIAYDKDQFNTNFAVSTALDKFISNYAVSGTLLLDEGIVNSGVVNIVDEQRKIDEISREAKWLETENLLLSKYGKSHAEETIAVLKELYKCYDGDMIYWLAGLYDVNAGFYYSNSGRDTTGYGSDLESTVQALQFLEGMGAFENFSNKSFEGLSEEFTTHIALWVKSRQDPNGYFYHTQWDKTKTDAQPSRLGRDLGWATQILEAYGYKPTYDTPNGVEGDGIVVDPITLTIVGQSIVTTKTNKVQATSDNVVADRFVDVESFQAYLDSLDIWESNEKSYSVSNTLSSQIGQIKARDEVLDPTKETTPLTTTLLNWLDSKRDAMSGLWIKPGNDVDYHAINGAFKVISIYQAIKKPCSDPEKVVQSCLAVITNGRPREFETVVYLYNIWNCMDLVIKNVNWYGLEDDKTAVATIRSGIISNSVEYISKTHDIINLFVKNDKSCSYKQDSTSATSQGMPVAIKGTNEGDVNATSINYKGILTCMLSVLNIKKVNPFGEAERMQFILAIERQQPIVKIR